MSGATFGRKGAGQAPGPAARRAAFLADERAYPRQEARPDDGVGSDPGLAARRAAFLADERAYPRQEARPDDGVGSDPGLAARRAAFLAEERARPRQEARPDDDVAGPRPNARAPLAPKSMYRAYMHWFFGGGLSAHRFYLGFPASAIIQMMLTPISYVLLMNKSPVGLMVASAATCWLIGDAFLIPGLLRRANERGRGPSLASTFG